jgi:dimethylamine monooxygenase subunit A
MKAGLQRLWSLLGRLVLWQQGGLFMAILHEGLPKLAWMEPATARLPGIQPVRDDSWLVVDEAFAGQMGARDRLIAESPALVHAMQEGARPAAEELYDAVLAKLARTEGYRLGAGCVLRPDGVEVELQPAEPLLTLGRLVQEDLCLMQKQGDEHVLTAAILCFPASWTLAEKLGRAMIGIHQPVAEYSPDLAKRVQRLFDAIRPEQPLWRMNYNVYAEAELFQPRREADPQPVQRAGRYLRSERQCLLRLPQSDAVLFSIHTYLVPIETLSGSARDGLVSAGKLVAL